MKKLISVVICLLMVLSLLPFTVSAADEIDFTLRIKEETDSELTLTLDYDGGTGFSALDIEIAFDRIRLELKSCEKGDGYVAFEKYLNDNNEASICSINQNENPVKAAIANTLGFKAIDGKKSVLVLKFAKVPGTKFAKEDVTFEFTNCQTSSFTDIKVNFDYDLTAPVTKGEKSTDSTEYPQQPSADNIEGEENEEIGDAPANDSNEPQAGGQGEEPQADDTDNAPKTKTVIIMVAVIVCAAGVAAVVIFKTKGKKK
ncbi:MAG: hypothetical protein IJZ57_06380 [Clostridia bacterium]|nr:hypothetical protein [Clostridia bacterium]